MQIKCNFLHVERRTTDGNTQVRAKLYMQGEILDKAALGVRANVSRQVFARLRAAHESGRPEADRPVPVRPSP